MSADGSVTGGSRSRGESRRDASNASSIGRVNPREHDTMRSSAPTSSNPAAARLATLSSWALGLLLVIATAVAYRPAWNAGYIWDDDVYVTGNELLTAADGLRRIWFSLDSPSQYFPLTYTTFWVERRIWGLNPTGYHWVNILLHGANALLAWSLLRRLRVPGAWLAAALFALHPVNVESVAWITERKNVLMGFFFLLALLAWDRCVSTESRRQWQWYTAALLLYALALFSKTTACTLPAALFLLLWLKGQPITWRRVWQIVPFVVLGIAMGLVTIWWERYHQGTAGSEFAIAPIERILIASRAVWFYLGKLCWPVDLMFSYPRWSISANDPWDYGWLLLSIAAAVAIWFARRLAGRSIEVAALFFVATLSPMLGFFMLWTFRFTFVADHYQYISTLGPLALAAAAIVRGSRWVGKSGTLLLPIVSAALLSALAALTWNQSGMYRDLETLWRTTIARNPGSWMAYNNLGTTLLNSGKVEAAIAQFAKALEVEPAYATAHNNLGNALLRLGRADESLAHLRKAVELEPRNADVRNNLGNTLLQLGRREEAAAQYLEAVQIDSSYGEGYNNLGALALSSGRVAESIEHLRRALQIMPRRADAHNNIANAYVRAGRIGEAVRHYNQAIALKPDDINTQNNFAWLLATCPDARLRDGGKAVELAERADRASGGNNPVIAATLSAAYAEVGRFPEAVTAARRALDLASRSGNTALADAVRAQVALYESGIPSRDEELTPR